MDVFFRWGCYTVVVSLPSLLVRTSGGEIDRPRIAGASPFTRGNPCPRAVSGWQRRNLGVLLPMPWRDRLGRLSAGGVNKMIPTRKLGGRWSSEGCEAVILTGCCANIKPWNFLEIIREIWGKLKIAETFRCTEHLKLSVKNQQEIRIAFLPDASSSIPCASISRKKTTPQLIKVVISTWFSAKFFFN